MMPKLRSTNFEGMELLRPMYLIREIESNLFRATENVVLNKVPGYKIHGEKHSFLEDY